MITETFGEMLFYPETECLKEFPSPEELKYRIIISTKPLKSTLKLSMNSKRYNPVNENNSNEDTWGKDSSDISVDQADDEKVGCEINVIRSCSQQN